MIALLCLQLAAAVPALPASGRVYHARQGNTVVHSPRGSDDVTIDGRLDEPQWRTAAVLTGFSLYQPIDGAPSPDSTEVLVWHSATALYVAVRAWEPHGDPRTTVHATLADRDKITGDDNVQVLLDTFDDKHRAFVFGVNPLGVQGDGIRSEGGGAGGASGSFTGFGTDLSSDFLYSSSGHLTDYGYEVELRIPFKSLRFPAGRTQRWGINVIRTVQHNGYTETWTPVRRASASFLSQSGVLEGLDDLQRGRVLTLNPEVTARSTGGPGASTSHADWSYTRSQDVGSNMKWDVNSALTLNGTVHPDFSQVEADAAQIATDPRFALFFPEKRPFFIDGLEQFDVPHQLVYTRRIGQPIGAMKLTGSVGGTDVALLAAEDARSASDGLGRPSFLIARMRRDVAGRATLGLVYTDREDAAAGNRVLGMDARYLFGGLYYAQFQAVGSQTRTASNASVYAPLWEAIVDRTGRNFGFHYQVTGIADDFVAASGFVSRVGFVKPSVTNRLTVYGAPGSVLENFTTRTTVDGTWQYRQFFRANSVLEDHAGSDNSFTFRGGWVLTLSPTVQTFAFDPSPYSAYAVAGSLDTLPFVLPGRLSTASVKATLATPQYRRVAASTSVTSGSDVDFSEVDAVQRRDVSVAVDWHPSQQLRVAASYQSSSLTRERDGVAVATARIPRVKAEYQVSRPVFVRLVAQYDARTRLPLVDYRTGAPIVTGSAGHYVASTDHSSNSVRVDALFSYQPAPGTVVFLGYGSSFTEPDALAFDRLRRVSDGLFAKVSWLIRG